MKATKSLWRVSVTTTLEAEDAVSELLATLLGVPVSSYFDVETRVTAVTAYLLQKIMNPGAPTSVGTGKFAGGTPALPGTTPQNHF